MADEWCARVATLPAHGGDDHAAAAFRRAAVWNDALALDEFAEPVCFTTAAFADSMHALLGQA
ncbi:hypothetical protein [Mycobacterium sp.]|uniref:hypothetical protein n=1 Tax=Mycobacterium sp. TaxID=1785 RepID=UPI0031DB5F88